MYRQLQGLGGKWRVQKGVLQKFSLRLLKLRRTRKCWALDYEYIRRTDLGASSALWQKLITINPSTYLQFSGTDNCEMSIAILATKQLQICFRYLGQVYIHHFLLFLKCPQWKIHIVRFLKLGHSVPSGCQTLLGVYFAPLPFVCMYLSHMANTYIQEWTMFPDDESRDGPRNVRLLAIHPPDAAASPKIFYWIRSPWNF